jgi:hypothetical protein
LVLSAVEEKVGLASSSLVGEWLDDERLNVRPDEDQQHSSGVANPGSNWVGKTE